MTKRPHILLTNDDGIRAPGLLALWRRLKRWARLTVVAPHQERSSIGHGITLGYPLFVETVSLGRNLKGWALTGTPADCVKFGLDVICRRNKPDLVVAGINHGPNDGVSAFYSGTVAAAREGSLCGVRSVAFSLNTFEPADFTHASAIASKFCRGMIRGVWPGGLYNVNIPLPKKGGKPLGPRLTRQGLRPIHGYFHRRRSPFGRQYFWMGGRPPKFKEQDDDTSWLQKGYITVTPLIHDLTDHEALQEQRMIGP